MRLPAFPALERKHCETLILALVSLTIFLVCLPLANAINFKQNDDWVYYRAVDFFQHGNLKLSEYIEATFYTQGLLGVTFAQLFSLEKLPILTLAMSVLNFLLFTVILRKFYLKSTFDVVVIGLLFFFAPLHIYSMLGFMTDNYFLFFALLAFAAMEHYFKSNNRRQTVRWLVLVNLSIILGFLVRQTAIFSSFAFIVTLLTRKQFRAAAVQTVTTGGILYAYFNVFSLTEQMTYNHEFAFERLLDFQHVFDFTYAYLMYCFLIALPLPIALLSTPRNALTKRTVIIALLGLVATAGIFVGIGYAYRATGKLQTQLYYLSNTLEQKGFFYGGTLGQKYSLQNSGAIHNYWELAARLALALSVVVVVVKFKRLVNLYTIFAGGYIVLLLVMRFNYDRYILPLIPVVILALVATTGAQKLNMVGRLLTTACLVGLILYSYNLAMDFVLTNRYMWDYANNMVGEEKARREQISAGYAWRRIHKNETGTYKYWFHFQPKTEVPELKCCYYLFDTLKIWYPLDLFERHEVYLYKRLF